MELLPYRFEDFLGCFELWLKKSGGHYLSAHQQAASILVFTSIINVLDIGEMALKQKYLAVHDLVGVGS
ncbi:hypothetical protein AY608_12890 [Acinetobacter terrae]|nr:hypothetical protein AY608_12890 [Acinetobacter terrae]